MSSRIPLEWAAVMLTIVFMVGCTENPVKETEEETDYNPPPYDYVVPDLSEDIVIGYAQTIYVESEEMTIRFSDFLYDARCPEGALCFWEGQAEIEFTFRKPGGENDVTVTVVRPGLYPFKEPETYECCLGYRLYALALEPYPVYDTEIDPEEYLALIRVVPDEECCDDGSVCFTWASPGALQRDPVTVTGASIICDDLTVGVLYSGGCLTHDFKLFMQPAFLESWPVQANLYLRHIDNGDACRALINERITFDIRDIAELYMEQYGGYDDIIINIYGYFRDMPENKVTVTYSPE
jgi:hypothetical protein